MFLKCRINYSRRQRTQLISVLQPTAANGKRNFGGKKVFIQRFITTRLPWRCFKKHRQAAKWKRTEVTATSCSQVGCFFTWSETPSLFQQKNGGMLTYFSRHRLHNFWKEIVLSHIWLRFWNRNNQELLKSNKSLLCARKEPTKVFVLCSILFLPLLLSFVFSFSYYRFSASDNNNELRRSIIACISYFILIFFYVAKKALKKSAAATIMLILKRIIKELLTNITQCKTI